MSVKNVFNKVPQDCKCYIFEYLSIKDLFKNVALVCNEFNFLINTFNSSCVFKTRAVCDLKYCAEDVKNLGKKKLKTIIKTYRYVEVLMILEELFYYRFIENIEKVKKSEVRKDFFKIEKEGKIDWSCLNKCKFRNKFTIAYFDSLFFWKYGAHGSGELLLQKNIGENSVKESELWLHPLTLKNDYGFSRWVYIKDLDKVINLARKFMPNLSKMYFDVRCIKRNGYIRNLARVFELQDSDFKKNFNDDIKKNFDNMRELRKISTKKDFSNNVQIFEVRYVANKIEKLLTLYFGDVIDNEKGAISKENEEELMPKSIEYLLKNKIENKTFKTALKFLYSKKYHEVFVGNF